MSDMNGKLWVPNEERWQHRAVKETGGNQSALGCLILAILGWQHNRHPPRFGDIAIINYEGYVITNFQKRDGTILQAQAIEKVENLVHAMRDLCDRMNLNDIDRMEMFEEFKKWISRDYRADQTPEERGIKT